MLCVMISQGLTEVAHECVGQDLATLVELEQPGIALEKPRRPGQPRRGEKRSGRAAP